MWPLLWHSHGHELFYTLLVVNRTNLGRCHIHVKYKYDKCYVTGYVLEVVSYNVTYDLGVVVDWSKVLTAVPWSLIV